MTIRIVVHLEIMRDDDTTPRPPASSGHRGKHPPKPKTVNGLQIPLFGLDDKIVRFPDRPAA